ncbi:hypothetical protein KM043_016972 [Ampulex compressa]|nr:hypothetical protein KM043_016972 [Ampulex compressa]
MRSRKFSRTDEEIDDDAKPQGEGWEKEGGKKNSEALVFLAENMIPFRRETVIESFPIGAGGGGRRRRGWRVRWKYRDCLDASGKLAIPRYIPIYSTFP